MKFSALFQILIRMDLDQEELKQAKMKKILADGLAYTPHPSAENRVLGSLNKIMKLSALFQIRTGYGIRMNLDPDKEAMNQAKMEKFKEKKLKERPHFS
jgi:hypothetical protein